MTVLSSDAEVPAVPLRQLAPEEIRAHHKFRLGLSLQNMPEAF